MPACAAATLQDAPKAQPFSDTAQGLGPPVRRPQWVIGLGYQQLFPCQSRTTADLIPLGTSLISLGALTKLLLKNRLTQFG